MQTVEQSRSGIKRWRQDHRLAYDGAILCLYLAVIYGWTLGVRPLGRDYPVLAAAQKGASGAMHHLLRFEMRLFDDSPVGYHLVNLALLLGCMLLLYRLTNRLIGGRVWLGNFAAVLFMANPIHTESVLNLTGAVDLVPCAFALAALLCYAIHVQSPSWKSFLAFLVVYAVSQQFVANLAILPVLLLIERMILAPAERCLSRLALPALLTVLALFQQRDVLASMDYRLSNLWGPVYLVFYPIGYLPESAQRFHEQPWLGWLAAATTVFVLFLVLRKARRATVTFAVLAMLAVRLVPGVRPIDPVHLTGGGQLLLVNAFFAMAVYALFWRMMDHVRWRPTLVGATTVLSLIYFGLQIHSNRAWTWASDSVAHVQSEAARRVSADGEAPIGLLPDWRHYITAPVGLSEALSYDTPFSRRIPHVGLLPIDRLAHGDPQIDVETSSPEELVVAMDRAYLKDAAPWPYDLARPGGRQVIDPVSIEVLPWAADDPDRVRLRIVPVTGSLPFPSLLVPEPR